MEKAWKSRTINRVTQYLFYIYVFTVFILSLWCKLKGVDLTCVIKASSILFLGLTFIYFMYCMKPDSIPQNTKDLMLLLGGYIFSFLAMIISQFYNIYFFWMFGVVLITVVLKPYLGIGIHFLMTILAGYLVPEKIENTLHALMIGILLCIVGTYMISLGSFFWGAWMILFIQFSVKFIQCDFVFGNMPLWDIFLNWGSSILIIWISGRINMLWKKRMTTFLEESCRNNPLQERLKEFSLVLYNHGFDVAQLSFLAAQEIGCDKKIAWEAGFYHEIGRIEPQSNYIEAGVRIGEENRLSQQVISIISQCNGKFEKPQSKEAVVVMFSDSIISALNYIKRQEQVSSPDELVEQIFQVRCSQGMLDQSALTFMEYKKLKDFYKEFDYDNSFGLRE